MCFETEFGLVLNEEKVVSRDRSDITTAHFKFDYAGCKVLGGGGGTEGATVVGEGGDDPASIGVLRKEVQLLEKKLEEIVPANKRYFTLEFKVNTVRRASSKNEVVTSVDILTEGDLLKGIHSAMSCGPDDNIGLKLNGNLIGVDARDHETKIFSTFGHGYAELLPQPDSKTGKPDHSKYGCSNLTHNLHERPLTFGTLHTSWKVSNLSVVVKRHDCNCGATPSSELTEVYKRMLEGGVGADVEIIARGDVIVPCHGSILIAQSPVFERMLAEGHFMEASTRRIEMVDRSPEEVKAFLTYLYIRGTEAILKDPSLTLTMLEMGDYYGVKNLKEMMRTILLKKSFHLIPVNTALRMLTVAELLNDPELNKKAVDALALRADTEVLDSELFEEMFPAAIGRKVFLNVISPHRL